jgi:protein ImuA
VPTAPSPSRGARPRPKIPATPEATIAELRGRIRALEQGRSPGAFGEPAPGMSPAVPGVMPPVMPLGVPAIDAHLPDGGLRLAGLHEIVGARDEWDDAVAAGFCLALLGRLAAVRGRGGGPVLWAARRADLYGPGVAGLLGPRAVYPGRLILARARRDAEVLWALEEGLRAPAARSGGIGLGAVVGEVGEPDGTAMRRLQLAAETAGRPCFLLRRRFSAGCAAMPLSTPGAALTRWRVGALPSTTIGAATDLTGLPGRPRWRVDLLRCRGAAPGSFTVEWDDAAGDFALAAPVCDRPVAPRAVISAAADRRAG